MDHRARWRRYCDAVENNAMYIYVGAFCNHLFRTYLGRKQPEEVSSYASFD